MNRTLKLRREVLSDLADADLVAIAGGATTVFQTLSCYTFVSCNPLDCVTRYTIVLDTDRVSLTC